MARGVTTQRDDQDSGLRPAWRRSGIAAGINVNVTLLFSLQRYAEVIEAYQQGLERRMERGLPIGGISSVASFFVSRVDGRSTRCWSERPAIRIAGERSPSPMPGGHI